MIFLLTSSTSFCLTASRKHGNKLSICVARCRSRSKSSRKWKRQKSWRHCLMSHELLKVLDLIGSGRRWPTRRAHPEHW